MKYLDEYRDPAAARRTLAAIRTLVTRPWTVMEVCGGQTHAILKYGLDQLLPSEVTLLHGPGCPVCVTPAAKIDRAIALASRPEVILCSFGDMLRVPGSAIDLLSAKAAGGDVRVVYSPLDALDLARRERGRQVVFFAVGFETTAPGNAMAAYLARRDGVANFSLLVSHVLVPPALEAILSSDGCRVRGFLAAGHVCAVTGAAGYLPVARRYRVPIVITGFEPLDLLMGLHMCLSQLEQGRAEVENQYARVVREEGNPAAQALLHEVFEVVDREWRGIGVIPSSGLGLRRPYEELDAERRFGLEELASPGEPASCQSGLVLQGRLKPSECGAFGKECTPDHPLGATMVSSEGACAAYYLHRPPSPDAR
ncbi:MAG: hydrogenase formation protein HypD [Acidobacteria bacterium]|nr:hydrogenase formation protein HypD [Acidobacteriota bacterium]